MEVLYSLDALQLKFPSFVDFLISDDLAFLEEQFRVDAAQLLLSVSDSLAVLLHHCVDVLHFLALGI